MLDIRPFTVPSHAKPVNLKNSGKV